MAIHMAKAAPAVLIVRASGNAWLGSMQRHPRGRRLASAQTLRFLKHASRPPRAGLQLLTSHRASNRVRAADAANWCSVRSAFLCQLRSIAITSLPCTFTGALPRNSAQPAGAACNASPGPERRPFRSPYIPLPNEHRIVSATARGVIALYIV